MKLKGKIISLIISLSICLVALFNVVYFRDGRVETHDTVMNKTQIDYMSLLDEFDEKEVVVEGDIVKIEAVDYIDEDFFEIIDNASVNEKNDKGSITYDIVFDGVKNVFILKTITVDTYGNETITETEGVPFINEYNEVDAVFVDDEGNILLSELTGGEVDNCGFFSRLKKALKKVAVAVAVVAVAAVVVAAVAACPTVGVLVTTTGAKVLAITGTIGTAAAVNTALTTAVVAGTTALVTYGLSQITFDSYVGTADTTYQQTTYKPLSKAITATIAGTYELTASRDYKIAYIVDKVVTVEHGVSLNYIEALSVLLAAGFLTGMTLPSGMKTIPQSSFSSAMNDLLNKIKGLNLDSRLIGIYTYLEEDAAKLAYACGGFFKGQFRSENHDVTSGSGHYYHFHDAMHKIHVFYGNPS